MGPSENDHLQPEFLKSHQEFCFRMVSFDSFCESFRHTSISPSFVNYPRMLRQRRHVVAPPKRAVQVHRLEAQSGYGLMG